MFSFTNKQCLYKYLFIFRINGDTNAFKRLKKTKNNNILKWLFKIHEFMLVSVSNISTKGFEILKWPSNCC